MQYQYRVTKKYGKTDTEFASFTDLQDAVNFIEDKLMRDASNNEKMTYRIFDFDEVYKEFDPEKINVTPKQDDSTHGSQGRSSTSSFSPTPFNTAPRPSGSPQKWVKDSDEEKK